ncbi:hypothetical protein CZ809_02388 [Photobacterium piscicola]|uniref:Uncharacterized protein n=1 Tax=Photobacterium piscicola TaxID=1378299 RepID=A0A1T5I1C7_9GAMM|nr:hypothetical protein [Photobacterium piscicola]SKC32860.1 hypothetical protein CZ809_02388 [Photobacterium piscicola]
MKQLLLFYIFMLSLNIWTTSTLSNLDNVWLKLGLSSRFTNNAKIDQITKLDKIPNLKDRGDDLLGIDSDNNGIRDDIDTFIQLNYPNVTQKKAVEQLARGLQKTLIADINNKLKVKQINKLNSRAINCIFSKFNSTKENAIYPARVASELESITTKTKKRLLAYLKFNKALDGTTWSLPVGDSCE